jgi:hypothetical protein
LSFSFAEKKIRKSAGEGFQWGCKGVQLCLNGGKRISRKYIHVANPYTIVAGVGMGGKAREKGEQRKNFCCGVMEKCYFSENNKHNNQAWR